MMDRRSVFVRQRWTTKDNEMKRMSEIGYGNLYLVSVADTGSCHSREGGNPVFGPIRPFFLYKIFVFVFPQQELFSLILECKMVNTTLHLSYYDKI
jgi:hypothetical protein